MHAEDETAISEQIRTKEASGRVVIEVGLLVTLYFGQAWATEVRALAAACAESFLARCGDRIRWTMNQQTLKMVRYDHRKAPSPSATLSSFAEDATWELFYHGGEQDRAASALSFRALCLDKVQNELGFVQMSFPLLWFMGHSGSLPEFALEACQRLHPVSGYGGIGILESPDSTIRDEFEPTSYAMAQRFPGLEVDYPWVHGVELEGGIKGVNWLTILSEPWLSKMGGAGALRAALDKTFVGRSFEGGLLIQAGPRPLLGDAERGSMPEPYTRLAALLAPVQIKEHGPFHHAGADRFTRERSEAWLRRLLMAPGF